MNQRDDSTARPAPAIHRGEAASNRHSTLAARGTSASAQRAGVVLGALLALATAACGKGAKGDCPQLDICGGSPASDTPWQVTDYCQVLPVRPSQATDVIDFMTNSPQAPTVAPPQANPVVTQQTTSGDWCSNLVLDQSFEVTNVNLWHEAPQISHDPAKPSTMIFGKDGTYLTKLVFEIPPMQDYTHFAPRCLVANGAVNPTCDKLADGLTAFYKSANAAVPSTFSEITCAQSPSDGGCDCTYRFTLQVDDSGQWAIDKADPTVLDQDSSALFNGATMNAQTSATTVRSSLCATSGLLQLSGLRGGSLSNVQGLRTLALVPMQ